ncbi:MAG: flagellar hook-associated protein FlgK [Syntrophobacteraceae bacterium]
MAGLALTLNTAEDCLLNTQTELSTSSNNIANANTAGYAVETAAQTQDPSVWSTGGWIGTGASITSISEARNNFIEQQLMNANTSDSYYTNLSSELTTVQAAASDSGSNGISQALGNFFDSWSTLAQDPTGPAAQQSVYSAAQSLATAIQSTYSQLNQVAGQIPSQITDTVNQANTLIQQIQTLNQSILTTGQVSQPNSLIDQRYEAMDQLSQLIPVSFSTESNGSVDVSTIESGASTNLVLGATSSTPIASSSGITGGELGGLLQAQTSLSGYMAQFDDFAQTLESQVNTASGLTIFSGAGASSITANSSFLSGLSADSLSSLTQSMSSLQDSTSVTFTDGTTSSLQQYLSSIQDTIGSDVQSANNNQTYYDSLKTQLQNQQQSVSGVSLDQEMVDVIQYQQIYQAAAKVVETTSTLMNTAINMVP